MTTFPVPLAIWLHENGPKDTLVFQQQFWQQVVFVQTEVAKILATNHAEYDQLRNGIQVVGAHLSKSMLLPVYSLKLSDGTMFTLRGNFENWTISVDSPIECWAVFMNLFRESERIDALYCEGFPADRVYGPYARDKKQFTLQLPTDYHVFSFFWIFSHQVLNNRNKYGSGL